MSAREIDMSDEPSVEVPLELAPRPAPSPAEVMAASTTSTGHWSARTLAQWDIPWPLPNGWREETRRLHGDVPGDVEEGEAALPALSQ